MFWQRATISGSRPLASLYLAWHRVHLGYFPPGSQQLTEYAASVDGGCAFLETTEFPGRTPYALMAFELQAVEGKPDLDRTTADGWMVQSGFRVLDYLLMREVFGVHAFAGNIVPNEHPFWTAKTSRGVLLDWKRASSQEE